MSARRRLLAAAATAAVLVPAAPAAADSIAYIKAGDVWLASPDGSRQQPVTRTGGYAYVSQADDGTMIALAPRERLHRLSRLGKVLADFPTMVSDGAPGAGPVNRFHGPFTPEISPDGTRVAYEWFNDDYSDGPGCSEASVPPCAVYRQSQGVAISHVDRYTGPEAFGLMTGWIFPHWVSGDVLLRSFSGAVLTDDAVLTTVSPGGGDRQLDPWFFDEIGYGVDDVELSRDAQTVVGIAGQNDEKLRVYRTLMAPAGAPDWNHRPFHQGNQRVAEPCLELSNPNGGKFETPSLAPDGRGLAYGVADGIWVTPLPALGSGCAAAPPGNRLLLAGGRHPDWGPAGIPPARDYEDRPGPGDPPPPKDETPRDGIRAARPTVRAGATRLGPALRTGLALTVTTDGAGVVTGQAMLGRRVLATGSARPLRAGAGTLRLRFSKAGRRAAAGKRRIALAVRVRYAPATGAAPRERTVRVILRR